MTACDTIYNKNRKGKAKRGSIVNPFVAVLCVVPATAMILLVSIIPASVVSVLTFSDFSGEFSVMQWVGFENWKNLFNGTLGGSSGGIVNLLKYSGNTLYYSILVIIPMEVLALVAAVAVNHKLWHMSNVARALFFMPNILGVTVVTTIWNMIFDTTNGPVQMFFTQIGFQTEMLSDSRISMILVSIASTWAGFGFSMAIYLAGLQGISKDYYEAAEVDGATGGQKFFRITLPLIVPSINICLWTALNTTLHVSDYIFLMTAGNGNTKTLGFYIFDVIYNNRLDYGQTSVISLVFFVFCSAIMMTVNKALSKLEVEV